MELLAEFGIFLLKTITLVLGILFTIAGLIALSQRSKGKDKGKLSVSTINQRLRELRQEIESIALSKKEYRQLMKAQKKQEKSADRENLKKVFVLQFKGDIRASAVENLRHEITAILSVAKPDDEIVLCLESPGGMVPNYGLAASQLMRIKEKKIPLTVCIDKMAASGGYMMACVADQILAAPFAIIGSIGVVAQLPNFNKLLKKNNIDLEIHTAGEHKRTLTLFGENTNEARKKFKSELEEVHAAFKKFITDNRNFIDIEKVATGEHWLASDAHPLNLVDKIITSDDYLSSLVDKATLLDVQYEQKKSFSDKLTSKASIVMQYFGIEPFSIL